MPLNHDEIERAVLTEIVCLHPARLTLPELELRMTADRNHSEGAAVKDSIQMLKRSGLVRQNGDVLEPTYPALRAAAVFL
jgi:hypothetical protein